MRIFQDRSGRQWAVDITVLTVERVKAACGVDMPALFGDRMAALDALLGDHMKLTEVIFESGRPMNEKAGLTVDDLRAEWEGTTADAAVDTWLEELVGFFPSARKREALTQALTAVRALETEVADLAKADLSPEVLKESARKVYQHLQQKFSATESGSPSGNSPATLESTPVPSLSASST